MKIPATPSFNILNLIKLKKTISHHLSPCIANYEDPPPIPPFLSFAQSIAYVLHAYTCTSKVVSWSSVRTALNLIYTLQKHSPMDLV